MFEMPLPGRGYDGRREDLPERPNELELIRKTLPKEEGNAIS